MKKNKILTITIFAAICAISTFAGCSKNQNGSKISFILDWTPNTNHTGLFVAQEKGFFAEEGLEVEIIQPSEDSATMMVASGRAQFGVGFQDSLAPAILRDEGIPVTAVAALLQHNTSGIISLKKAGIENAKALEGKKYATWNSPIELATIQKVMENDGGDFSKVQLIPSTVYDVVTALNTEIDAVWIYYAWDGIKLGLEGLETNYLDFAKLDEVFDYYTPLFIANSDFLKKHPDSAKKFLKALRRGYEYSTENIEEAAEILCKCAPELDRDLVYKSQKWISPYYKAEAPKWGYIDAERWNRFFRWLNDTNLLDGKLPENFGFTNEYLN